jgi:hypothetical protein
MGLNDLLRDSHWRSELDSITGEVRTLRGPSPAHRTGVANQIISHLVESGGWSVEDGGTGVVLTRQ